MPIEEELELALRAEAQRIDPPIAELVEGGVAHGRMLRRRQRVRLAAGAAALVLVAGAGTVLAIPFLGGDDGSAPVAASDSEARTDAAPPLAGTATEIDPDAVVDAVVALLPTGKVTQIDTGSEGPASAWFQFAYDDGDGASWMMGSVHRLALDDPATCPVIVNGGSCEVRDLGAAGTVMLQAGPYYSQPGHEPDRLLWSAHAVAPGGLRVGLAELNTPTKKESEPTRAEPPLSLDELSAVVTDGVWAELTAGIAPASPPDDVVPQPEITDETRAFAAALGPGWTPVDDGVAEPDPSLWAGLPDGYIMGSAVLAEVGPELTLEQQCTPGEEKGAFLEACVAATAPGGQPIHVQWGGTVAEGPYAQDHVEDRVNVLVTDDTGRLVRVSLRVAEPVDVSTPQRREAARGWLADQVDDLARAATAAVAGQLG